MRRSLEKAASKGLGSATGITASLNGVSASTEGS